MPEYEAEATKEGEVEMPCFFPISKEEAVSAAVVTEKDWLRMKLACR